MVNQTRARDWSFVRRPGWVGSHLFAAVLIVGFVFAGFWQLDRLEQRQATNAVIEARSLEAPVSISAALARLEREAEEGQPAADPTTLDYVAVADTGAYLDGEVIRVANRSQDGLGGDWVVGLFVTDDEQQILVNRGFSTRDATAADPPGSGPIRGWLRASQEQSGLFGAIDTGTGPRTPRLDVDVIAGRLGRPVESLAPVWVQLDDPTAIGAPQPVPLPGIDEGSHFSYAMQWFSFALLSVVVYSLLLRKRAGERPEDQLEVEQPQSAEPVPK